MCSQIPWSLSHSGHSVESAKDGDCLPQAHVVVLSQDVRTQMDLFITLKSLTPVVGMILPSDISERDRLVP